MKQNAPADGPALALWALTGALVDRRPTRPTPVVFLAPQSASPQPVEQNPQTIPVVASGALWVGTCPSPNRPGSRASSRVSRPRWARTSD